LVDDYGVASNSKHGKASNRELNLFSSSTGSNTTDFSSMTDPSTSLVVASVVATPTLEWNQLKSLGLCAGIKVNSGDAKNVRTEGTSAILEDTTSTQHHRALNINTGYWKERSGGKVIVPYTIDTSVFSADDRAKIDKAMRYLEGGTGSVMFVPRVTQSHYITVVRRDGGCYKFGGTGGVVIVNLASGCMSDGTIQHELIHALGLGHEQTRPDRDQYVTILWDNIEERYKGQYQLNGGSTTLGSPYDYRSVMHYKDFYFQRAVGLKTMLPKGGNTISPADKATDLDIKKLKLLYQCERGFRNWGDMINNPCTSDCKCREGETGCGSNNDACHGTLVCIANKCATPPSTPNPAPSPSPDLWGPYEIGQSFPGGAEDDYRCIDLKGGNTSNGNQVWYYPCNQTPAQLWYWDDSNNYIRSSIDKNKCLVGVGGSSALNTKLMIWDCFNNDNRFKWDWYASDDSLRPRNNKDVCIEARDEESYDLILDECNNVWKSFHWWEISGRRRLLSKPKGRANDIDMHDLRSSTRSNLVPEPERRTFESEMQGTDDFSSASDCVDSPIGWYDFFGRNCAWYGELESNCEVYGHQYANFGHTALSACCVCGGGQSSLELEEGIHLQEDPEAEVVVLDGAEAQTCWDQPNWYDSTGDGCAWYEGEHNCEYYGDQFLSIDGLAANDACCTCGGGLSSAPALLLSDDVPGCSDNPFDWSDEYGNGCDWYSSDAEYCKKYGDLEGAYGKTPNEACCACGGGFNPNMIPPKEEEEDDGMELNGAKIILEECNPSLMSQQWAQDSLGRLVNRYSGMCIEAGDTGGLLAEAFLWTCDDVDHQQWDALSDGRYRNRKYSDTYLGVSECGESDVDHHVETRGLEESGSCKCAQIWNTDCTIQPPPALAQTSPPTDVPISSPSSPPTDAPTPNLTYMPSSPHVL
jgi:hypothetical protein